MKKSVWLLIVYFIVIKQSNGTNSYHQYEGMPKATVIKNLEGQRYLFVSEKEWMTLYERDRLIREKKRHSGNQ